MLSFDFSTWERAARQLGADLEQVPFALSVALNDAVKATRLHLTDETWPQHVQVRNRGFARAALRVQQYANKRNLTVVLGENPDLQGRGNLGLQARGGTKQARRGKLAIPLPGTVVRTGRGVRASQRPAAIIARTPKRALRVTPRGILVGKNGRLELKYTLVQQARQPADVPLDADFAHYMERELRLSLPAAVARAMKTKR